MSLDVNSKGSSGRVKDVQSGYYIARGLRRGESLYRKFGRIEEIQAVVPASCWEYGITVGAEIYTFPTSDTIDTISSSNATDTQEISVGGLDRNYNEVNQLINLDGQNKVPLITKLLRHNRVFNNNGVATLGDVYVYEDTAIIAGVPTDKSKVKGFFSIAGQQSLQSVYTTPAGVDSYLTMLKTSMGGRKAGFATYEAFLRLQGGVFRVQDTHDLAADGNSVLETYFNDPSFFPEKTDFNPIISVSANGIGFSVSFRLRQIVK